MSWRATNCSSNGLARCSRIAGGAVELSPSAPHPAANRSGLKIRADFGARFPLRDRRYPRRGVGWRSRIFGASERRRVWYQFDISETSFGARSGALAMRSGYPAASGLR